jgi:hypothetical protein
MIGQYQVQKFIAVKPKMTYGKQVDYHLYKYKNQYEINVCRLPVFVGHVQELKAESIKLKAICGGLKINL